MKLVDQWRTEIREGLEGTGVDLSETQEALLILYLSVILENHTQYNLTAVPPEEWGRRHIADALSAVPLLQRLPAGPILDIGSGLGVPGIPLAVLFERTPFVLLESSEKRCAFLRLVVRRLALRSVRVVHGTAEEYAHVDEYREQFAIATARAVAPLPVLIELLAPFLHEGGSAVAYCGPTEERNLSDLAPILHDLGVVAIPHPSTIVGSLLELKKIAPSPRRFPRRAARRRGTGT